MRDSRNSSNWCGGVVLTTLIVAVVALLASTAASAIIQPQDTPLREKELRDSTLQYENVFQPLAELPPGLVEQLAPELERLGVNPGQGFIDRRTGRWGTLILTQPLIPGDGVGNNLSASSLRGSENQEQAAWQAFRTFLANHAAELRIDPSEFGEPRVTSIGDYLIQIYVGREHDGIPVRGAYVTASINSGNLVLMGQRNWGNLPLDTKASIPSLEAEAILRQHLGTIPVADFRTAPRLEFVPTSTQPDESMVTLGAGLEYRLAWVLSPDFQNDGGTWEALVDADSGELLSFQDTNHYVSRQVGGGIYPVSNDGNPPDGVEVPDFPMPFADIAVDGTPNGFTTTGGNVPPGSEVGTITTTLSGEFVNISDNCGAIDESADTGDLDLGVSGGTDCTVPAGHSAGDTHSSRTGFYELNRLIEQAQGYLPGNTWLQGQLTANMNINQSCNAFWNGVTVNFYRSAPGVCGNTGEIAAVFDHEWGHGMDDNDGNPTVSNPGEGLADIFGHNRLHDSCIGRGFFTDGSVCGGYGDPCIPESEGGCTGIRDTDWAKRVSGMPHDIAWIDANCGGGGGPCGGSVHCEGAVYAEALWDLVHRDLMPPMDLNTALELGTRLTYFGSSNVGNWFQCVTDGTGGCNADGGYLNFLAADDDNGNINDGTPHMQAIFAAFERHQISCNTPAVVDSGCAGGPTTAPTNVVADPSDEAVTLTWDAVTGATGYQIFRTEGVKGCDFGKAKVGETTNTTFTETGLRNGFEVLYSVVAVGTSDACTSPMSACQPVTPLPGPSGFIAGTVTNLNNGNPIEGALVETSGDGI